MARRVSLSLGNSIPSKPTIPVPSLRYGPRELPEHQPLGTCSSQKGERARRMLPLSTFPGRSAGQVYLHLTDLTLDTDTIHAWEPERWTLSSRWPQRGPRIGCSLTEADRQNAYCGQQNWKHGVLGWEEMTKVCCRLKCFLEAEWVMRIIIKWCWWTLTLERLRI